MKNTGALGPSRLFFLETVLSPAENSWSDLHSFGRAPSPAITVAKLRHRILIDSGRLSKKMKAPLYCSHRGNLALNVCTDSEGKSRRPTFHAGYQVTSHFYCWCWALSPSEIYSHAYDKRLDGGGLVSYFFPSPNSSHFSATFFECKRWARRREDGGVEILDMYWRYSL